MDTRHWPAHTRAWRALRLTCVQSEIAREEATVAATWAPRKEATLYLRGAVCGTVRELQAEVAMRVAAGCDEVLVKIERLDREAIELGLSLTKRKPAARAHQRMQS